MPHVYVAVVLADIRTVFNGVGKRVEWLGATIQGFNQGRVGCNGPPLEGRDDHFHNL